MKDFIFIIGPSAVGKTTLAKELYQHYNGVYFEQNMVPEFSIPEDCEDVGVFEWTGISGIVTSQAEDVEGNAANVGGTQFE